MRVISGSAKGTSLVGPGPSGVRPTLDRVKESYFNLIGQNLDGLAFLDLFAGTGNMGIEALSRGASRVVFVEPDSRAQKIILANLARCRFGKEERDPVDPEPRWTLMKTDALRALTRLTENGERFDFIYVDPPFADDLYGRCLSAIGAANILSDEGRVAVEHFRKKNLDEVYGPLLKGRERRLGDTVLSFFSPSRAQ